MNQKGKMWLPVYTLWQRDIVRFLRQRNRVIGALVTPLVFWLLLGFGFSPSFHFPGSAPKEGMSYLEYFFPGTIILIMLFTAIFSTISIIEDRREGFLQAVLVAPVSPGSIVFGKVLGGATLAVGQGLLFLFLTPFAGLKIAWFQLPLIAGILFLIAFGLTALGFLAAWPMHSTQGFHAVMNLLIIPLWMLSGALFPVPSNPVWMLGLIKINPVTYDVTLLRHALYGNSILAEHTSLLIPSFLVSLAFAVIAYGIAYRMVKSHRHALP